ncbi:MAG: Response regulator of zinc sigma-54-dependent two-component system [Myxococcaceae bacterium]|nr:Response regulator of zinc sigma-54-dependent two-component system [Myxococcaceae bacterium]
MTSSPNTEFEQRLPLNLSRLRRSASLEWTDSRGPHKVPLAGAMVIGTAEGVPIVVADPKVSRLHAEVELDDRGVRLRDLGSRNGTWLEAVRAERVHFEEGGHFRVGGTELTITFESQPTKVPLWPQDRLGALLGGSEPMRELFMQLTKCANSEAAVLVYGETGTGKELVAQELHAASRRSAGPFVVVDCASLPENLLEAELFGHVRGAFTGAAATRVGSIEAADGGTVFLDEIGELPQSRSVRRVGETEYRPVNVRFVTATHRDLERMVAQGQFREDLFFRLSVLPLRVPPLRERSGDIPLLLAHFLGGRTATPVDAATLELVKAQKWAGNVRQLRSFAERVVALGLERATAMLKGTELAPAPSAPSPSPSAPLGVDATVPFKVIREQWVEHLERAYLEALIARVGRNAGTLAEAAGLDRSYINRLFKKHGL